MKSDKVKEKIEKQDTDEATTADEEEIFKELGKEVFGGFGTDGEKFIESCKIDTKEGVKEAEVKWSDGSTSRYKGNDSNVPKEVVHVAPVLFKDKYEDLKSKKIFFFKF